MRASKRDHLARETGDVCMRLEIPPVVPTRLVVLAIRVVVAVLPAAAFIAAEQHRHPAGDEQREQEVLDLAPADRFDAWIGRVTFQAVIVAEILIDPVAATLAVGSIMLFTKAHQVVEREPVMTGHVVDAALRTLTGLRINIGAAADAARKCAEQPLIAAPKAAHIVTKPAIPFGPPAIRKTADLIRARGIPRLSDEFGFAQDRILGNLFEQRRIVEQLTGTVAAQDRGEVESKAIHVHLDD